MATEQQDGVRAAGWGVMGAAEFGAVLRDFRERLGVSQAWLAKLAEFDHRRDHGRQ
jgi:hypothetical protein